MTAVLTRGSFGISDFKERAVFWGGREGSSQFLGSLFSEKLQEQIGSGSFENGKGPWWRGGAGTPLFASQGPHLSRREIECRYGQQALV